MARVDKLHLGDDGRVRSATLKTKSVSLVRPLVKLVPLPDIGSYDQERGPGCSGHDLNYLFFHSNLERVVTWMTLT